MLSHCQRCASVCPEPTENPPCDRPVLYYEAHVTVEPVFGERYTRFEEICKAYKFKAAILLLQKDRASTEIRSNKDSFATGHGRAYDELEARARELVYALRNNEFEVWRLKIEACVLDEKYDRTKHKVLQLVQKQAA